MEDRQSSFFGILQPCKVMEYSLAVGLISGKVALTVHPTCHISAYEIHIWLFGCWCCHQHSPFSFHSFFLLIRLNAIFDDKPSAAEFVSQPASVDVSCLHVALLNTVVMKFDLQLPLKFTKRILLHCISMYSSQFKFNKCFKQIVIADEKWLFYNMPDKKQNELPLHQKQNLYLKKVMSSKKSVPFKNQAVELNKYYSKQQ